MTVEKLVIAKKWNFFIIHQEIPRIGIINLRDNQLFLLDLDMCNKTKII